MYDTANCCSESCSAQMQKSKPYSTHQLPYQFQNIHISVLHYQHSTLSVFSFKAIQTSMLISIYGISWLTDMASW